MLQLCVVLFAKWLGILSALLDVAAPLYTMSRCPYWSSTAVASRLSCLFVPGEKSWLDGGSLPRDWQVYPSLSPGDSRCSN